MRAALFEAIFGALIAALPPLSVPRRQPWRALVILLYVLIAFALVALFAWPALVSL